MSKTYLGNWNDVPVYSDKIDNKTVEHCVFHEISNNLASENNQSEADLKEFNHIVEIFEASYL